MAFNFGAAAPAPAASGGFSFGASPATAAAASAPANPGAFSFASPSSSPAASSGFAWNFPGVQSTPPSSTPAASPSSAAATATSGISFGFPSSTAGTSQSTSVGPSSSASGAAGFSFNFPAAPSSQPAPAAAAASAAPASAPSSSTLTFGSSPASASSGFGTLSGAAAGTASSTSASTSGFAFGLPSTASSSASASSALTGISFGLPSTSTSAPAGTSGTQPGQQGSHAGSGSAAATSTTPGQQAPGAEAQAPSPPTKQPLPPLQLFLKPTEGSTALVPASYGTRFEDLHPESQKQLLQLEERVFDCRAESTALSKVERIAEFRRGSLPTQKDIPDLVARVRQRLASLGESMAREHASLSRVLLGAHHLVHEAETAVRSFSLLCYRFRQLHVSTPISDAGALYSRATELSPFLAQTVQRFEGQLMEVESKLEELERILLAVPALGYSGTWGGQGSDGGGTAASIIPSLLRNFHAFFMHVAALMEPVHEAVEDAKAAFLAERRRRGDLSDPFQEAARLEEERQAGGVPSLDAMGLKVGGPSGMHGVPGAGFGSGLGAPGMLGAAQVMLPGATPGQTGASSPAFGLAGAMSPFGAGLSASSSPFGAASTPAPFGQGSLFGAPANSFGSAPALSFGVPGSIPPFGAPATTPAFGAPGSTPAFGQGLFGVPSTGAAPSGLFGAASSGPAFGTANTFGAAFGASTGAAAFGTPPPLAIPNSLSFGGSSTSTNSKTAKSRSGRSGRR